jgi:hypothetical protein
MKKNNHEIDYDRIFKGKKIPILTLDERWYELFPDYDKPSHIKEIEVKLNMLMKRQGKLINDLKDIKILKENLMKEIITHMDVNETKVGILKGKRLDRNKKMIKELSERKKNTEDELIDIPYQIKAVNEQLIIESVRDCNRRLSYNNQKVVEIAQTVEKMREDLKNELLIKQDMEMKNTIIYSYMHDMLGPELLQDLDENLRK